MTDEHEIDPLPAREADERLDTLRREVAAASDWAIVEMGRLFRAGKAGPADLAEAEARALAFRRPGDAGSLGVLWALRREACALPSPPPFLDELNAELDRRQAIGREPAPPALDDEGLEALRAKAGAGDVEASYQLGRVLIRREQSAKPEALAALQRAAEAGHAAAAFQAGTLLYHGWGVPRDVPTSLALLESSAGAGNADAARFLALEHDGASGHIPKDPEVARKWWNEAARLGDPHACWFVGRLLIEEWETVESRDRGWELVEFAAERGFPHASGYIGVVEAEEHRFHPERYELALPPLRLGAVRGDYEAASCLAECHRELGGEERYAEAAYWLRKAAFRHATAARLLARHYYSGFGVPLSAEAGTAWLALASEDGDADATVLLAAAFRDGMGVPIDVESAIALAEGSAADGCRAGARFLGALFDHGDSVPRDGARAVAWYERGAELHDRQSMFRLGNILFDGRGVDPDPARAVGWLEKAVGAFFGDESDHLLALMTFRGEGVAPDTAKAKASFFRASDAKHLPSLFTTLEEEALRYRPAAIRRRDLSDSIAEMLADPESLPASSALDLGLLCWNGDAGLPADHDCAAELFGIAARKGSALAAACLSHALYLAQDENGEMEWLEKAALSGLPGAQRHLAFRLVKTGRAAKVDARLVHLLESAADGGDVRACVELVYVLGGPGEPPDPRVAERIRSLKRRAEEGGYEGDVILEY